MKFSALLAALLFVLGPLATQPIPAADFHGFDPAQFDGRALSPEQLQAMVAQARSVQPPKNGDQYVFGFANLQRDMVFGIRVEDSILANAQAAGVEVLVTDNRLDGATALANAESFIRRRADFVIEFQTDVNFGPVIMQRFNRADIGVVAIDIPMPGATFFGANNPRSGYMGGSYLGQAALQTFGAEAVDKGFLVIGALPQSGAIPAMRTAGQRAGFLATVANFPETQIIEIDTKNTLQYSFQQMSNVLGRIPPGVPIMVTAINDQSVTGMLRAVQQAGRQSDLTAVGNGADELETLMAEERLVASVGYFPERYGNYLIPISLMRLAGLEVPPSVLVHHVVVTPANACQYYPDVECVPGATLDYQFPEEAFKTHLAGLADDPELADYRDLIPAP
ncbi:MAG: substrate-binding domain-containing protein [Candidatus Latescibacteria bacterium]|nr:substrate-binding domain-containing protein [Candidatus Latescibacterota bacterium]